jgi:hypothetical protein
MTDRCHHILSDPEANNRLRIGEQIAPRRLGSGYSIEGLAQP